MPKQLAAGAKGRRSANSCGAYHKCRLRAADIQQAKAFVATR